MLMTVTAWILILFFGLSALINFVAVFTGKTASKRFSSFISTALGIMGCFVFWCYIFRIY